MSVINITGGTPFGPIVSQTSFPLQGRNTGDAGNIYISGQPGVTPTQYDDVIAPGGAFTKPPEQQTYLCTDAGVVATLTYTTDGSTVASNQVTGTVGTRASNAPTLIFPESIVQVPPGLGVTSINPPNTYPNTGGPVIGVAGFTYPTDVSSYSSVIIRMQVQYPLGTPQVANFIDAQVILSDTGKFAGTAFVQDAQWLISDNTNGLYEFAVPVREAHATFQLTTNVGIALNAACTIAVRIYGSNEAIMDPRYVNANVAQLRGKPNGVIAGGAYATVGTTNQFINSTNEPCTLAMRNASAATSATEALLFYADNGILTTSPNAAVIGTGSHVNAFTNTFLPCRPVCLQVNVSAAGGGVVTVSQ